MMQEINIRDKPEKEAIHSGHFMVSHFEAEEQDDEDDVAVPVPETEVKNSMENIPEQLFSIQIPRSNPDNGRNNQQLSIETSLSKLFQCMSLAYRQKLTSPKWNRFRGIRLRWKDKIRLNNVIWRCWHMQFIMRQNTLICQFASPLDVDQHNKPEAVVLEGKYWKRKLQAVTAEYKKWRMYYRNQALGCASKDIGETLADREALCWNSQSNDALNMMVDEDYMDFMSDTLFSTITNQPFAFPDSREIAKAGLADFIQPSLGPLQPNLDDFMDTLEPLNGIFLEFINSKLPPVPEEQGADAMSYKSMGWDYSDLDVMTSNTTPIGDQFNPVGPEKLTSYNNEIILALPEETYLQSQHNTLPFHPSVISKTTSRKQNKTLTQQQIKISSNQAQTNVYKQPMSFSSFPISELGSGKSSTIVSQEVQSVGPYKITQTTPENNRGYKFTTPIQTNLKFTGPPTNNEFILPNRTQQHSQQLISVGSRNEAVHIQKELEASVIKCESGALSRTKNIQRRPRSRSTTREPQQRPPLLSAVSDPAIINTSSSVLLTQLLTTNNQRRASLTAALSSPSIDKGSPVLVKREEQAHTVTILPTAPPPVTTLIITTPSTNSAEQILLSSMSASSSPSLDHSSRSLDSPESPSGSLSRGCTGGSPGRGRDSTSPHRDQRRAGHIHAEQKRRYNIKNGFDMIHSLIPHLNQNPNAKLSKAAMLQKGADYIRQLRSERNQLKEEMDTLRQQIESLNTSISNCQSMLPATGAPVSRRRDSKMQEIFDDYVRTRTLDNWKFWIFSLMIKPLLVSYNNFVSTSSLEDLYRSTMLWVEQHCTLVDLRPVVLNSLRYLCTKTEILADPEKLPDEARQAVMSMRPVYP